MANLASEFVGIKSPCPASGQGEIARQAAKT